MAPMTSFDLSKDVLKMLGLPEHTRSFSIHVTVDEIVSIKCEYYPSKNAMETVLKQFKVLHQDVFDVENSIGVI